MGDIINTDFFRYNIVEYAYTFLNKKYIWGAKGPHEFDEGSLVWYIYKALFDIDIIKDGYGSDDTSKILTSSIGKLTSFLENDDNKSKYIESIALGDIVFFHTKSLNDNNVSSANKYPGDAGIYIGNKSFIHASYDKGIICIETLSDKWLDRLVGTKDIIDYIGKKLSN